jgi:hypothetical protein
MTEAQILSNLNQIIELTGSMLEVAHNGDWEQVRALEQQRKELFDKIFPLNTDSLKNVAAITRQVQKLADMNKETMAIAEAGSEELARAIGKITTGRHAVDVYKGVQGR